MIKKLDKKRILQIIKLLFIMLGMICILKMYYVYCLKPAFSENHVIQNIKASKEEISDMEQFVGETIMEQEIMIPQNYFGGFQLMFRRKSGGISEPVVKIELIDNENDEVVEKWNVDIDGVVEYLFQNFNLKKPIKESMGKQYVIKVYSNDMEHIAPAVTNYDSYEYGGLSVGSNLKNGSLVFALISSTEFIKLLYICFSIIVLCGIFVLWILYQKNHKKEENYFLVLGIVWGMMFMFFFSPNTAPDERAHEATAYAKANSILGKELLDSEGNVLVRESDVSIKELNTVSLDTIGYICGALAENTNEERVSFVRGPLNVSITAHFPQAMGIVVGWLLHANGMVTLYLGKLFALIFYLVCCYFAIKWIPWGKMVLMIIALFPMSLELAGSYSYDCTVNAICFLFTAYVMKLIYKKQRADWKDYVFLAVLAVWMAPCKVVYVFVCGLIFAVPKNKIEKKSINNDLLGKAFVFGAGIVAVLIQRLGSINNIITADRGVTVANYGLDGFTLEYILTHPKQSIGMVFNTFFVQDEFLFGTTIGSELGWFQVHISWVIVFGFVLLLCVGAIADYDNKQCMCKRMRCLVIMLSLIIIVAIAMSMWLDATPIDYTYLEGMQGRYFLPILPMLMLTLKNNTIVVKKNINQVLVCGLFSLELLTMFEIWGYLVR